MPSVGPVSAVAGILTALLCGFLYPINPTACKLVGYLGERLPAEFIAPSSGVPGIFARDRIVCSPCSELVCKTYSAVASSCTCTLDFELEWLATMSRCSCLENSILRPSRPS